MISIRIYTYVFTKAVCIHLKSLQLLQTRTNLKLHKMSNIYVVLTEFVNTKIKI